MRKIFILILVDISVLFSQGQKPNDSTKTTLSIPMFVGMQVYGPKGGDNRFNATYRFGAGGAIQIGFKKFSIMAGGRFWGQTIGEYSINSRSLAQTGFHGALGVLYKFQNNKTTWLIGPALNKISYFPADMITGENYKSYLSIKKKVRDSMPGIRGTYYSVLYLFAQMRKKTKTGSLLAELNVLIPARLPVPLNSWQPKGGSLVHALRAKVLYERKKLSYLFDYQAAIKTQYKNYKGFVPEANTYKIELGYNVSMTGGKVKIIGGYEKDWHAFYFPDILRAKGESVGAGTWKAFYIGLRFEAFLQKK